MSKISFKAFAQDATPDWQVEYRHDGQAKVARFENYMKANAFFESCKSDPSCSDIVLFDPQEREVRKDG